MTAAPPMINVRYFSKKVGSAATARRGRFVERFLVVVGRTALEVTGVGVVEDEVIGAGVPSVVSSSASVVGGGV